MRPSPRRRSLVARGAGSGVALLALGLAALLAGTGGARAASRAGTAGITVYAAASLTDVFPALDRGVRYSFAGSNALAVQLANGAPADVFASADTSLPAQLHAQGIVGKPVVFARNALVIVVPRSNPAGIESVADLEKPGVKLVVANAAVPVGSYTVEVLKRMGLARAVLANVVSQETDVRAVLSKVQLGQADAGFVYSTDARTVPNGVTVIPVPPRAQPTVRYSIAVVSSSRNKAGAQAFVDEVTSDRGQAILQRYGFLAATSPEPSITGLSTARTHPGARLTLTGRNFEGTTSVTLHGVPARFEVVSNAKIVLTVPAKAKTGPLTVTSPAGSATSKPVRVAA